MLDAVFPGSAVGKPALRGWARDIRARLDLHALSHGIVEILAALPEIQSARHVLLYLPMPDEVQIEPLIARCEEQGGTQEWYAPRCAPGRRLAIHPHRPGETLLRTGPWGIREPDADVVPEADAAVLNVVLVPALLLTSGGARLGYGGGYYDRFLPRLSNNCCTVGALPSPLVVPELPVDGWDVSLDKVVTELGIS